MPNDNCSVRRCSNPATQVCTCDDQLVYCADHAISHQRYGKTHHLTFIIEPLREASKKFLQQCLLHTKDSLTAIETKNTAKIQRLRTDAAAKIKRILTELNQDVSKLSLEMNAARTNLKPLVAQLDQAVRVGVDQFNPVPLFKSGPTLHLQVLKKLDTLQIQLPFQVLMDAASATTDLRAQIDVLEFVGTKATDKSEYENLTHMHCRLALKATDHRHKLEHLEKACKFSSYSPQRQADCYLTYCSTLLSLSHYKKTLACLIKCKEHMRRHNYTEQLADALTYEVKAYQGLEQPQHAIASYAECAKLWRKAPSKQAELIKTLEKMARYCEQQQLYTEAIAAREETAEIQRKLQQYLPQAHNLEQVAKLLRSTNATKRAVNTLTQCVSAYKQAGRTQDAARCCNQLAEYLRDSRKFLEAAKVFKRAAKLWAKLNQKAEQATALSERAQACCMANKFKSAITAFDLSMHLRSLLGDQFGMAEVMQEVSNWSSRSKDFSHALQAYDKRLLSLGKNTQRSVQVPRRSTLSRKVVPNQPGLRLHAKANYSVSIASQKSIPRKA